MVQLCNLNRFKGTLCLYFHEDTLHIKGIKDRPITLETRKGSSFFSECVEGRHSFWCTFIKDCLAEHLLSFGFN